MIKNFSWASQGTNPVNYHCITLEEGANPVNLTLQIFVYVEGVIEKLVDEILNIGIIKPSTSPLASPMVLVKNKDGGSRLCVDYRALNRITIKNIYPIPIIEDLLDELGGARLFSKLDRIFGYHHIRVRDQDRKKLFFIIILFTLNSLSSLLAWQMLPQPSNML